MGHSDHETGPRIDLNCDQCGDLNLYARWIYCIRCLDQVTVCFECMPKDACQDEPEQVLCSMCSGEWENG